MASKNVLRFGIAAAAALGLSPHCLGPSDVEDTRARVIDTCGLSAEDCLPFVPFDLNTLPTVQEGDLDLSDFDAQYQDPETLAKAKHVYVMIKQAEKAYFALFGLLETHWSDLPGWPDYRAEVEADMEKMTEGATLLRQGQGNTLIGGIFLNVTLALEAENGPAHPILVGIFLKEERLARLKAGRF